LRRCEIFLRERGVLLGDHGFTPDPGRLETTGSTIAFYHYTRPEKVDQELEEGSGLWARLPVVSPPPELEGHHLAEGLLEPLPMWMTDSPYFGDLGIEMLKKYVGDLLLRVEVPRSFPGLFVADYGHMLELKHLSRRGRMVLDLGYSTATGHEVVRSQANSYITAAEYRGGHLAPELKATRRGKGIVVPSEYIEVCAVQPLR
jgi:hypothetical protein